MFDRNQISDKLTTLIEQIRLVVFDFDGVFTGNTVYVFEDGREAVRCWRGDGLGLRKLEHLAITPMILSTERNPVVNARARKLNIRCENGIENKYLRLQEIVAQQGLRFDQVAYVGNDINDRKCLGAVGLPIVVCDAHPDLAALSRYRTKTPGGRGAVREICDLFDHVLSKRR
jgi:YrbI family 3-deoxy-D-manno-octulosonate 8-phosphate phosphatase